eukprot:SAG22_NODE_1963_length_3241_cov_3.416932_8_plen_112_part_00
MRFHNNRLEVGSIVGRDVKDADIDSMLAKLTQWGGASVEVIAAINAKTDLAVAAADQEKRRKAELGKTVCRKALSFCCGPLSFYLRQRLSVRSCSTQDRGDAGACAQRRRG